MSSRIWEILIFVVQTETTHKTDKHKDVATKKIQTANLLGQGPHPVALVFCHRYVYNLVGPTRISIKRHPTFFFRHRFVSISSWAPSTHWLSVTRCEPGSKPLTQSQLAN